MKLSSVILSAAIALCGVSTIHAQTADPVPVPKTNHVQVFTHLMPWFESKDVSGYWGIHWTMATRNPDVIDANGHRQIASYYYPLVGPYASSDPDLIDYQLLTMKLAGIDGVMIDWPGTSNYVDYPRNRSNAEALIARIGRVGLSYAIIYEDQNINIAYGAGAIGDRIGQAQQDMAYVRDHYFNDPNYVHANGRPLLGVFGPQTFTQASDWNTIFSVLPQKPCFMTLWYQAGQAPQQPCVGEYSWIYQDGSRTFLQHLSDFYMYEPNFGVKVGSVFPGFTTYYKDGGWGDPTSFTIPDGNGATFQQTLDLGLSSGVAMLQLATWNDYGEGTMIEPTQQLGYGPLVYLQQRLGVPYGQAELELPLRLYQQRKKYAGNASEQSRLDQVVGDLVSLDINGAKALLSGKD